MKAICTIDVHTARFAEPVTRAITNYGRLVRAALTALAVLLFLANRGYVALELTCYKLFCSCCQPV
jgi:Na+-translocating ferredoxin:NAD+ oxidoreductase RnfD subunit